MRKLAICMMTYELPGSLRNPAVSGEVKNPYNLVRGLNAAGHDVTVITVPTLTKAVDKARLRPDSVPRTFDVPEGFALGLVRYASRIYNVQRFLGSIDQRFDVFHAQHPALALAAFAARKRFRRYVGVPVVTTGHGTGLPEADADGFVSVRQSLRIANARAMLPVDRAAFRASTAVISVSKFQQKEMADLYGVARERISVIYNGVDRTLYYPDVASRAVSNLTSSRPDPVILFVGRLVPKKGLQYLIEAFPAILSTFPGATCVVVGGSAPADTYGPQLRTMAERIGVAPYFRWLRDVPEADLPRIYAGADLCVFPSENYESLPTVVFEAMACGVPVIATNRWGTPEALGADHPGLIPEADPGAIVRAVTAFASDPDTYGRVRDRQLADISGFELEKTVADHEAVYTNVIDA